VYFHRKVDHYPTKYIHVGGDRPKDLLVTEDWAFTILKFFELNNKPSLAEPNITTIYMSILANALVDARSKEYSYSY
jgi:hypothetical protein